MCSATVAGLLWECCRDCVSSERCNPLCVALLSCVPLYCAMCALVLQGEHFLPGSRLPCCPVLPAQDCVLARAARLPVEWILQPTVQLCSHVFAVVSAICLFQGWHDSMRCAVCTV